MSTTYPKCRTCRHYEPWPTGKGKCRRIIESSLGARVHSDMRRAYVRLEVEPDFGCLLHSDLEIEIDQRKGEG